MRRMILRKLAAMTSRLIASGACLMVAVPLQGSEQAVPNPKMKPQEYRETFDRGAGGWIGWDGRVGPTPVEIREGVAISRSPWWVDCNHAPPGAGYLHILFALHLRHGAGFSKAVLDAGGANHFVKGGFPTDLTNARVTVRIKGDVKLRGAQMVLLAQGDTSKDPKKRNMVNQVLVAQPIRVTPEWSEQTITLVPDQRQWVNLGTRHDRVGFYGTAPIGDLLRDVNADIIFVLFPLDIRPMVPVEGNMHEKWWDGRDGKPDASRLPEGHIMLDEVRIAFP